MSITITNPSSISVNVADGTNSYDVAPLGGQVSIDLPADGSAVSLSVKEVIASTQGSGS